MSLLLFFDENWMIHTYEVKLVSLGAFLLYGIPLWLAIFVLFSCFCRIWSLFSNQNFFAFLRHRYFLVSFIGVTTVRYASVVYLFMVAALCSLDLIVEKRVNHPFMAEDLHLIPKESVLSLNFSSDCRMYIILCVVFLYWS